MPRRAPFASCAFINCPFDSGYYALLRPLLFSVVYFGFTPRIATERSDSAENRLDKITGLIRDARLSIHDISRLKSSAPGEFSRFNLPFELGIAYAARAFGSQRDKSRRILILERDPYAFKRALSDLSGVDIKSHADNPEELVRAVRDWFVETIGLRGLQGPTKIWYRFTDFTSAFYKARKKDGFSDSDLDIMPIPEYIDFIIDWVKENG